MAELQQPFGGIKLEHQPFERQCPRGLKDCFACKCLVDLPEVISFDGERIQVQCGMNRCNVEEVFVYFRCKVCSKVFVEETMQMVFRRMNEHRNDNNNTVVIKHFKSDGHNIDDHLEICVIGERAYLYNIGDNKRKIKELLAPWHALLLKF